MKVSKFTMMRSKKPVTFGHLVVIRRKKMEDGSRFPVTTTECTIGRSEHSTVRVYLPSVGRVHYIIKSSVENKSILLNQSVDSNLNGRKLEVGEEATLEHLDLIGVADRIIRWEYSKSSPFHPANVTWTAPGETDNKRIGDKLEARSRSSNRMVAVVPPLRRSLSESEAKSESPNSRRRSTGSLRGGQAGDSADLSRVTVRRGGDHKKGDVSRPSPAKPSRKTLPQATPKNTPAKIARTSYTKAVVTPALKRVSKAGFTPSKTKAGKTPKSTAKASTSSQEMYDLGQGDSVKTPVSKSAKSPSILPATLISSPHSGRKSRVSLGAQSASKVAHARISVTPLLKSAVKQSPLPNSASNRMSTGGRYSKKLSPARISFSSPECSSAPKSTPQSASTSKRSPLKVTSTRSSVARITPSKETVSPVKTPKTADKSLRLSASISKTPLKATSPRKSVVKPTPVKESPSLAVGITKKTPMKANSPRKSVLEITPAKEVVSAENTPKIARKSSPLTFGITKKTPLRAISPRKSVAKVMSAKRIGSSKKLTPNSNRKSLLLSGSISKQSPVKANSSRKSVSKVTPAKEVVSAEKTPKVARKSSPLAVSISKKTPLKASSPRKSVTKMTPAKEVVSAEKTPKVARKSSPLAVSISKKTPLTASSPRKSVSKMTPAKEVVSAEKTPKVARKSSPLAVGISKKTPLTASSPRKSVSKMTPAKEVVSAEKTPKVARKSSPLAVSILKKTPLKATSLRKSVSKATPAKSLGSSKKHTPKSGTKTATSPRKSVREATSAGVAAGKVSLAVKRSRLPSRKATPIRVPFTGNAGFKSPSKAVKRGRSAEPDAKLGGKPAKIRKLESPKTLDKKKMAALYVLHHKVAIDYQEKIPQSFNFTSNAKGSKIPLLGAGQQVKSPKSLPSPVAPNNKPIRVQTPSSASGQSVASNVTPTISDISSNALSSPAALLLSQSPLPGRKSTPVAATELIRSARKSSTPLNVAKKATPLSVNESPVTSPISVGALSKSSTPASAARPSRNVSLSVISSARKSVQPTNLSQRKSNVVQESVTKSSPLVIASPLKSNLSPMFTPLRTTSLRKSANSSSEAAKKLLLSQEASSDKKSGRKSNAVNITPAAKSSSAKKGKKNGPGSSGSSDIFSNDSLEASVKRSSQRGRRSVEASPQLAASTFAKVAKKLLSPSLSLCSPSPEKTSPAVVDTASVKRRSASRSLGATKKTPGSIAESLSSTKRSSLRGSLQVLSTPEVLVSVRSRLSFSEVKSPIKSAEKFFSPNENSRSASSTRSSKSRSPYQSDVAVANSTMNDSALVSVANVFKTPQSPRHTKRVASSVRPRLSQAESSFVIGSPVASTSRASLAGGSPWSARAPRESSISHRDSSSYDLQDLTSYDFDAVSTPNLRTEMLVSPGGIVQKSPKNSLSLVEGMKKLFREKVLQKSPKNDLTDVFGVRRLMKTTTSPKYVDVSSLGPLFDTPENVSQKRRNVQFSHPNSPQIQWISPPKRPRRGQATDVHSEGLQSVPKKGKGKASTKAKASPKAATPVTPIEGVDEPIENSSESRKIPAKGKANSLASSPIASSSRPTRAHPSKDVEATNSPKPTPTSSRKGKGKAAVVKESPVPKLISPRAARSDSIEVIDIADDLPTTSTRKGKTTARVAVPVDVPEDSPAKEAVAPRRGRGKAALAVNAPEDSPATKTVAPRKGRGKTALAVNAPEDSPATKTVAPRRGRGKAALAVNAPEDSPETKTVAPRKGRGKTALAVNAPEDSPATKTVAPRRGRGKAALAVNASEDFPETKTVAPRKGRGKAALAVDVPEDSPATKTVEPRKGRGKAALPVDVTEDSAETKAVAPRRGRGKAASAVDVPEDSPATKAVAPRKGRAKAAVPVDVPENVPAVKALSKAALKRAAADDSPVPRKVGRRAVDLEDAPVALDSPAKSQETSVTQSPQKSPAQTKPKRGKAKASTRAVDEAEEVAESPNVTKKTRGKTTAATKATPTKRGAVKASTKKDSPAKKSSVKAKAVAVATSPVALRQSKRTRK